MDTPRGGPQALRHRSQAPQVPGSEPSLQARFPVTQALPFLVTDCPRDRWKLSVLSIKASETSLSFQGVSQVTRHGSWDPRREPHAHLHHSRQHPRIMAIISQHP